MHRRTLLKWIGAAGLSMTTLPAVAREATEPDDASQLALTGWRDLPFTRSLGGEKRISLVHPRSGEIFDGVYWRNGYYLPGACSHINFLMRDRQRGESQMPIATDLLDLLYDLNEKIGNNQPIHLVSGYRADSNRKKPTRRNAGKNSYHLRGMAIDIRLPTYNLSNVRKTAIAMSRGGVGFYGNNRHLHLDVGPVRSW